MKNIFYKMLRVCTTHSMRLFILKIKFILRSNVKFKKNVIVNQNSIFEGYNAIYKNTEFTNSFLGLGSYIANNSVIRNTKIGRFCAIGDNVRTCLGMHPTSDFVSIHPAFFSTNKQSGFTFSKNQIFEEHKYIDPHKKYVVDIGNDVWIGNNVMILDGVKIGDGAILAGGSIVSRDVPPYAIVGGIPSKVIRYRFEGDEIQFLQKFKWWNKDFNWLSRNSEEFTDITAFHKKFR